MTTERLIQLFMFEPTNGKFLMSFEYRKKRFREETKPLLNLLKKDGLIIQHSKTSTTLLLEYKPKETNQ